MTWSESFAFQSLQLCIMRVKTFRMTRFLCFNVSSIRSPETPERDPSDLKRQCFCFVAERVAIERLSSSISRPQGGWHYRREGRPADLLWPSHWSSVPRPGSLPMTTHCKYAVTGADFCYCSNASVGHRGGEEVGWGGTWCFMTRSIPEWWIAMQPPLISTAMQCDWNML